MKLTLKLEDIPTWEEVGRLWKYVRKSYKQGKLPLKMVVFYGLLFFTGMRISEIVSLRKENVFLKENVIRFEQKKKKTKTIRETIIHPEIKEFLRKYLTYVRDWLFPKKSNPKEHVDPRLARYWVYSITKKVLGRRIRPHAFRHCVATKLLIERIPLEHVRRVLGHASYNTVKIYLNYTLRDIREDLVNALRV